MERLLSNLPRVKIPKPTDRIYKRECCITFDTPETPKPLTIGVDGHKKPAYEESYSIVILPDFVSLPFPCGELPETVRTAVETVLSAVGAEREDPVRAWSENTGMAAEHYEDTGYPLVVKLGTITAELEAAANVYDPLLPKHLSHFGINFSSMHKTEMTTGERELDHDTNFDWNRIQELSRELVPVCGPGYTGLVNLWSSNDADSFLDPFVYFRTKLGHVLLSRKYSIPRVTERQEGIAPRMFKSAIAAGHAEFSTMRQQDPLKFFLHLLDKVGLGNSNNMRPELDPSRSFKFGVEEKIYTPWGTLVETKNREDCVLSLSIPLDKAIIKDEWEAFNNQEENDMSSDEIVRPRVPFEACLATFSSPSSLKGKTRMIKKSSMTSFPQYLVLHMRKFVMEAEKLGLFLKHQSKKLGVFLSN